MFQEKKIRLDWVDGLKAFAIIGILWNHLVELFGKGPWFSNPSNTWPNLNERLNQLFPDGSNFTERVIKFIGWLGDMGPGIFILLSGFTLMLSYSRKDFNTKEFYVIRAKRIYPSYILIHIIIVVFLIVIGTLKFSNLFSLKMGLSIAGFRFTDSLFFYINPSWWFIGLIIQFYIIFPFLYKFLKKNPHKFLLITLTLTLLFRLAGIFEYTYSKNMYYWMTGLFCGTRLFEFTIGMYIATIFLKEESWIHNYLKAPLKTFIVSFIIYIIGFIASWTYAGALISNILITIGLSGIGYSLFFATCKINFVSKTFNYIGKNAFTVFLVHQPIFIFLSGKFHGLTLILLIISLLIVLFILAPSIERIANYLYSILSNTFCKIDKLNKKSLLTFFLGSLILILTASILIPITNSLYINKLLKLFKLIFAFFLLGQCVYLYFLIKTKNNFGNIVFIILITGLVIFILPQHLLICYSFYVISAFVIYFLFGIVVKKRWAAVFTFLSLISISVSLELFLSEKHPISDEVWGELPALQIDPVTTYSLIPNKTTHLKYNNYDYILRTNSLGFNSPEINLSEKQTNIIRIFVMGDAFSMPEGMEYKDAYPALLEKELQKLFPSKTIQVINGGVTGYGPNEMLAQLKKYVAIIKPDIVINEFFINEFEEVNISASQRRNNIGFGKDALLPRLIPNQLASYIKKFYRKLFDIPDHWFNYNKSLLAYYRKDSPMYSEDTFEKISDYFKNIELIKEKHNFRYYLLYVPGQLEVSRPEDIKFYPTTFNLNDTLIYDFEIAQKAIRKICVEQKIELWDTKRLLKESPNQPVYFPESWHWNKEGHKEICNYLLTKLKSEDLFN